MSSDNVEVTLPRVPSLPSSYWGGKWQVSHLLLSGSKNVKLARSMTGRGLGYEIWGLSLAPHKSSGMNVCPNATPGCSQHCLALHGRAEVWANVMAGRIGRSLAFFTHREWFLRKLREEVGARSRKALAKSLIPCFRLNVFSDIPWEKHCPELFTDNPEARFWDYSKIIKRIFSPLPENYRLTLSRSEKNEQECLRVLDNGLGNVAVVFHTDKSKALPPTWHGYPVLDGDESDLRFLDPWPGYVVGLRAKGRARRDTSGFAVPLSVTSLSLV